MQMVLFSMFTKDRDVVSSCWPEPHHDRFGFDLNVRLHFLQNSFTIVTLLW